ncbi:ABC transporter ATP-binding protein [Streptomyces sp. H27-D2]|uniref:ABC transporter ATP-binding protein n=1 Tax=Streptomyces sp. H27-D2 TaxID=3046304 RepID=UPI002DBECE87|nr:ATP-binding cassette domain-containing protein [Streptomyces sp. H27-D2]MEC4020494.1 ATP-binding cassette domain-containing protein [Streptomyces sp. H27-D2]
MRMPPTVARIDGLRVEVDGRAIVDGVSVELRAGRCTALIGASGSGKTTTGLALLGEYPAGARTSGTVDVPRPGDGTPDGPGPVGYVPQQPAAALNPARRAGALLGDIARLGGGTRSERSARVAEALRLAQLPYPEQVLSRYPHQLSGGQQQRVVLAQALLLGARVIVADEPTTGQDSLTKRRIVGELRELLRQSIAVLLLSHDLDVVRELSDEVVVLRDGQAVERGPADEVFAAPRHPWTRELLAGGAPRPVRTATRPPEEARADPDTPPRLAVHRVSAWHGPRRARGSVLREVSLSVGAGECLAVVGRSGSGKTTLARCLAGLHRGWTGRVRVDGDALPRSLRSRDTAELAAVQYVFQDPRAAFDEYRPVLDQVARTAVRLRAVPADQARTEALSALAEVGLGQPTVRRRPAGLSGGELQRAALARALLARPRVLVCDEITSGLDPVTRRGICALLRRLTAEQRTTLVLITHDLAVAAELGDRIVVLEAGRVVEQGPTARLLTEPSHPLTRELLAAADREVSPKGAPEAPPETAEV